MVKCGNFEISPEEGYVRIKVTDGYEYMVSKETSGDSAEILCNMFLRGYKQGVFDTQENIRRSLGI